MAKGKHINNKDPMLTQHQIIQTYGIPKKMIQRYFPKPQIRRVRGRGGSWWNVGVWPSDLVERMLSHPEIARVLKEKRNTLDEQRQMEEIRRIFQEFSPEEYIEEAKKLKRSFVLHVGPTNSGKTYDAIEDLKKNRPGTYLGPLRLLALEMFDKINAAGIPCSMLTGEEAIPVENAEIVSSTIELCDYRKQFRTAVIDEAQLIADPARGASWLKAICLVKADVVHICMAPEALRFIESLIRRFSDQYSIVRHERLCPLRYGGICRGYQDLRPDDALICFSRKSVLSTAALLERSGFRASVIYGALPPEARRNEVRKYTSGETNIVVATDAIGLGISLPIKRIVFAETEKYDGRVFRTINTAEVNQIGGRAGRYGLNEYGEVLVFGDKPIIGELLGKKCPHIRTACIAFPREVLGRNYPISLLLKTWQKMERSPSFVREDMRDALTLLQCLKGMRQVESERELVFDLITCPVDTKTMELVTYWSECARAILLKKRIPLPYFGTETLADCELQYKAYDIHHQLLRRIGLPDDCTEERHAICERIAELMKENKRQYIRRCRGCGKELPIGAVFNYCDSCYALGISG
ncbi:MAG: helicase [Oscillospiraceae bacterium]|nr:helicase [Oscillospiraceae bacterium]